MTRSIHLLARGGVLLAVLTALVALPLLATPAAAQQNNSTTVPEYYNDSRNVSGDQDEWLNNDSNATLDKVVNLATRAGTFVVAGGGSQEVGAVFIALLVFGAVVSIVGGSAPGTIAGVVVGVFTIAALAASGFAASWLWALVVFAVGVVLSTALIRALK